MFLSDEEACDSYAGKQENCSHAIQILAKNTAKPFVYSSQFHLFALATVIGRPIFSVYPDVPQSSAIKNGMHGVCHPRQAFLEDDSLLTQQPLHIMWSRAAPTKLVLGWTPNHFCPIIPAHGVSGFAEVVKRGKKKLHDFTFAKDKRQQRQSPSKDVFEQESIKKTKCAAEEPVAPKRGPVQAQDPILPPKKEYKPKLNQNKRKTSGVGSFKEAASPAADSSPAKVKKITSFFKKKTVSEGTNITTENVPTQPITKKSNDELEEVFPLLGPGMKWYKERGVNAVTNLSRTDQVDSENNCRARSATGSLKENIDALLQKLSNAGSEKQQQHFEALITLGNYLLENGPIIATQQLAAKYKEIKGITSKRLRSSRLFDVISKHLNVAQIYINGKAHIIENRGKELLDLLECLEKVRETDENIIKEKLKQVVGDDFHIICEYMDTKRDKDTLKAILAKLSSSTFMTKLANVQDKRSFQRAKNQVDLNIQLFKEMKNKVEEDFNSTDEAERRKKHRLLQKMKLEKLRHVFEGRGRMLKCEEFPDLAAVLEFAFGESDRIERGGGGLESHPRLTDTVLYRAADSNTIMKHARETILALAPKHFTISLSSCFNYTQNFKEGTYQAKRHHAGKGLNACISLHKPPRIGVEKFVINLRWSTHNVNISMDFAHSHSSNVIIDSKDAKAKVQSDVSPVQKPGTNMA